MDNIMTSTIERPLKSMILVFIIFPSIYMGDACPLQNYLINCHKDILYSGWKQRCRKHAAWALTTKIQGISVIFICKQFEPDIFSHISLVLKIIYYSFNRCTLWSRVVSMRELISNKKRAKWDIKNPTERCSFAREQENILSNTTRRNVDGYNLMGSHDKYLSF